MSRSEFTAARAIEVLRGHRTSLSLVMRGRSMEPLLREGMRIDVTPLERRPRVGDIAVFREGDRWVAHRVIRTLNDGILCAGDAQPENVERVSDEAVYGVVSSVRTAADATAPRCDRALFRLRGRLFAYAHPLRAWWRVGSPTAREPVYARLVNVTAAIIRDDAMALRRCVDAVVPWKLAVVARRHRIASIVGRAAAGIPDSTHAHVLASRLAAERYRCLLAAPGYRRQLEDVLATLNGAGIDPVFLKSAGRVLAGEPDAELFNPQDIDVLVDEHEVEPARAALRARGYVERPPKLDYEKHHHAAPLFPASGVPVEIHRRLAPRPTGAVVWNKRALAPFVVRTASAPYALVLDPVGASIHHVLHAYERPELREVALLARRLLRMSPAQRALLRGLLAGETHERIRIGSVLAFAALLAGIPWRTCSDARRFLDWSILREDLPRPLRSYPACVDAWLANPGQRLSAALRATVSGEPSTRPVRRALMRAACGVVTAIFLCFQSVATRPNSQN